MGERLELRIPHAHETIRLVQAPKAGVSRVDIERFPGKVKVIVHTAKPEAALSLPGKQAIRKGDWAVLGPEPERPPRARAAVQRT